MCAPTRIIGVYYIYCMYIYIYIKFFIFAYYFTSKMELGGCGGTTPVGMRDSYGYLYAYIVLSRRENILYI